MPDLPVLPAAAGFMKLPEADAVSMDVAKAVIIPFGLEKTVSYKGGTAMGPDAIIDASQELEWYDEEFGKEPFRDYGFVTLAPVDIARTQEDALDQLENMVEHVLISRKFPMILGGEHGLTPGALRCFARRYPDLVILHFDAHADLRDGYDGEHYSHASALRRCLDAEHVSLVSVGIRNISESEIPFLEANRHRIHMFWGRDRGRWDMESLRLLLKDKPIYITFDVDGFDASLMPATGTPEPGGIFWNDAMDFIRIAAQSGTIVGADVNELAPIPYFHACDFVAAKLVYKIMTYALTTPESDVPIDAR